MSDLALIKQEVEKELSNPEVASALIQTTFKGLQPETMKLAMLDGMIRGFTFKDFRERNVYAIPFRDGYSLVTSIDHARKIAMRNGILGIGAPVFEEADGKIVSCSITVKRKVEGEIGEFTATVYFEEYYSGTRTGRTKPTLWDSKPRTMISKVAEMHALRKACPEDLAQAYAEEEMEREALKPTQKEVPVEEYNAKLLAATNLEQLQKAWADLPGEAKSHKDVFAVKESMKKKLMADTKANEDSTLR